MIFYFCKVHNLKDFQDFVSEYGSKQNSVTRIRFENTSDMFSLCEIIIPEGHSPARECT